MANSRYLGVNLTIGYALWVLGGFGVGGCHFCPFLRRHCLRIWASHGTKLPRRRVPEEIAEAYFHNQCPEPTVRVETSSPQNNHQITRLKRKILLFGYFESRYYQ